MRADFRCLGVTTLEFYYGGVEPDSLGLPPHEVHDDEDDDPDDEIPDGVAFDAGHLHRLMETPASPAQAADPSMRTGRSNSSQEDHQQTTLVDA